MRAGVNASVRCATIVIVILSWMTITNHCAFGAIAAKHGTAQSGCPFHSKPAKESEPSVGVQCCKILRAVMPTVAKSLARNDADFSDVDLSREEFATVAPCRHSSSPLLLGTGPPGARTFAELILQRSILAHAPPVLA